MAPYFIRNLIPRREARNDNRRPLLEVLRTITWVQWAQFFSGYAQSHFPLHAGKLSDLLVDGWRGPATRSTFSAYLSVSLASKGSLTRPRHPPSCVVFFIWLVLLLRRPCE